MGEPGSSDSWRRMVIAKSNDQWVSVSGIKTEQTDDIDVPMNTPIFGLNYEELCERVKTEVAQQQQYGKGWKTKEPPQSPGAQDPLFISRKKGESHEERAVRLAKMSTYASQRLANETPEQRAKRLKRMSEYAAKRLRSETSEQRASRLARMSAYAARRLARETPEQRRERLNRMSAYAAKRHAMRKQNINNTGNTSDSQSNPSYHDMATITPNQS